MSVTDEKALIELYRRKVLNQELSLKEYAERKLVLNSKPSKILVEFSKPGGLAMPMSLFEKAAESLFTDAYLCDVRGFDSLLLKDHWFDVISVFERYSLINWHMASDLSTPPPEFWEKLMSCGFMIGYLCGGVDETFDEKKATANLSAISTSLKTHKRGFVYFIVIVRKENLAQLPQIMNLAAEHGVHEVQFKTVKHFKDAETREASDVEILKKSLDESMVISIQNKVRLTLNDQEFADLVDPDLALKASTVPYPHPGLNFPLAEAKDKEFWRERPWWPIDSKVIDRTKVSIYQKCFKPFHYVHVTPEGRVGPCNHLLYPDTIEMGNLTQQSFEEIWNGEKYQAFRKQLVGRQPQDERCQWCFQYRLGD